MPTKGNKDAADEGCDEETIVNALTQVKQFLGTGSPIENLWRGLRKFALSSLGEADRGEGPSVPSPVHNQTSSEQLAQGGSGSPAAVPDQAI